MINKQNSFTYFLGLIMWRLQLLKLEIIFLEFIIELLNNWDVLLYKKGRLDKWKQKIAVKIIALKSDVEKIKEIVTLLNQTPNPSYDFLSSFDQITDDILLECYYFRSIYWDGICNHPDTRLRLKKSMPGIIAIFESIDCRLDDLISKANLNSSLNSENLQDFQQKLDATLIKFQQSILQYKLGSNYAHAYYIQKHFIVASAWYRKLQEKLSEIKKEHTPYTLGYSLAVKRLLFAQKPEVLLKYYKEINSQPKIVLQKLCQNISKNRIELAQNLPQLLEEEYLHVQKQIRFLETEAKIANYTTTTMANILYFFVENDFFKLSSDFFSCIDSLDKNYQKVFSVVGLFSLCVLNKTLSGSIWGSAYSFLSVSNRFILNNVEQLLMKSKFDEKLVSAIPYLKQIEDFCFYAGLYTTFFGFNRLAIGILALSRFASALCSKGVGHIVNFFHHVDAAHPDKERKFAMFVQLPVQVIMGILSSYVTAKIVPRFFLPKKKDLTDAELLVDKKICANSIRGRKLAAKILGTTPDASYVEVKNKSRETLFTNHPDRNPTTSTETIQSIYQARDCLLWAANHKPMTQRNITSEKYVYVPLYLSTS